MQNAVARNVAGYTKRAATYDTRHPEIFNDIEQARLAHSIRRASDEIQSGGRRALDFGCGSGNLTRHLQQAGLEVVAADVTPAFLHIVRERFGVDTIELRDGRLDDLPDGTFDLIAMYSVLHHIPDYVASITDLLAKLKPGGVMLIEHERHPDHYFPTPELQAFRRENHDATRGGLWDPEHKRWQYLLRAALTPSRHIARWRKYRGVYAEGDIHVRADDHIEWDRIVVALTAHGAEIVAREDHLLYVEGYDRATWERWADRCVDQTALIARRA